MAKKADPEMVHVGVKIEDDTRAALVALAEAEQLTLSDIVRRAIRQYLTRHAA